MVDTSKQEYRSYGGCLLLYFPAGIPFKQVGFRAVQQKGQGYDCRERIKWRITYNLFPSYSFPLTCTHFFRVQVGILLYCL